MTEEEARAAVEARFGTATCETLRRFLDLLVRENERQNLVAASTLTALWSRHVLDSLQLLRHVENRSGRWIDIGSGGGFPGIPVALEWPGPVTLVEPRRKRASFLVEAIENLGIADRVTVLPARVEKISDKGAIMSARAVAGIEALFDMAHHCSRPETRWILPRGRIPAEEIDGLRRHWTFVFHVEQSDVDATSSIAIFDRVTRR